MSVRDIALATIRMAAASGTSVSAELDFCAYNRTFRRQIEREIDKIEGEERAAEIARSKPEPAPSPKPHRAAMLRFDAPESKKALKAVDDRERRAGVKDRDGRIL